MFIWLVLLVATVKMPSEKAALLAGTKQNLSNLLFFRYLYAYYCVCLSYLCGNFTPFWKLRVIYKSNSRAWFRIKLVHFRE